MPDPNLVNLARKTAADHQLFEETVCAIVEQESSWLTWLNRYEPEFEANPSYLPKLVQDDLNFIKTLHYTMTAATEMKNRATSWGLMQVMGQSARELGYREFIPELCDPASGLYWGCKIFTRKLECTGGDYQKALQLWNGGGNPNYAAEVMARAPKYKT